MTSNEKKKDQKQPGKGTEKNENARLSPRKQRPVLNSPVRFRFGIRDAELMIVILNWDGRLPLESREIMHG